MTGYSYAAVERALAIALGVDLDTQRSAFRARLKHLQRLGLPGIKAGKGARIEYTADQVGRWLIALLMSETGVEPVVTVAAIEQGWKGLAPWLKQATDNEALAGNHVYLSARPKLMSGPWARKSDPGSLKWIGAFRRFDYHVKDPDGRPIRREIISTMLDREDGLWLCVRNLTAAMIKLQAALPT